MAKWTEKDGEGNVLGEHEIPDPIARSYEHDVLSVEIKPGADIHHSDFPHPLVTVDYAEDGGVVSVTFVGPVKRIVEAPAIEMVAAWLDKGAPIAAKWVREEYELPR